MMVEDKDSSSEYYITDKLVKAIEQNFDRHVRSEFE